MGLSNGVVPASGSFYSLRGSPCLVQAMRASRIRARKERKIENTNLDCLFFIVYLLWLSIRGFTNILISIPAKAWTVSGWVEGRRSVRSLSRLPRFPQELVKVLCGR